MAELIATDRQRLSQEPKVVMFEIDARPKGAGILRFTPAVSGESWQVQWNGNIYTRLAIAAEGFEYNGTGTAPRPSLSLVAQDLAFLSLVINSGDLVGCEVKRIRTYRKYLDDGQHADPNKTYPIDYYTINKKAKQTRRELTFELSTKMDQEGKKLPAAVVIRDTCRNTFRYWANDRWNYDGVTCPYAGVAMYEPNGEPTLDPTKARCGKRLSDCKRHFGQDAVLPMFAFPGVGRIS